MHILQNSKKNQYVYNGHRTIKVHNISYLEALGQNIPLPRHVLLVSRSGSGSMIQIVNKI